MQTHPLSNHIHTNKNHRPQALDLRAKNQCRLNTRLGKAPQNVEAAPRLTTSKPFRSGGVVAAHIRLFGPPRHDCSSSCQRAVKFPRHNTPTASLALANPIIEALRGYSAAAPSSSSSTALAFENTELYPAVFAPVSGREIGAYGTAFAIALGL
jgi:hypothetical protein